MINTLLTSRNKAKLYLLLLAAIILATFLILHIWYQNLYSSASGLHLSIANSTLKEGDYIELSLRFENKFDHQIALVPPLEGSWDQLDYPYYILEFIDENGNLVPNALGRPPRRIDFYGHFIQPEGIFVVDPGEKILLFQEPSSPSTDAISTYLLTIQEFIASKIGVGQNSQLVWGPHYQMDPIARPGTYKVRVRYVAENIPNVSTLELTSNEVEVTLNGGNKQLWQCYQDQLHLAENHSYATLSPETILPMGDEILLVYSQYAYAINDSKGLSRSSLYIQRLDKFGHLIEQPVLVTEKSSSIFFRDGILLSDGLLFLVETRNSEGQDNLEIIRIEADEHGLKPSFIRILANFKTFNHSGFIRYGKTVGLFYELSSQEGLAFQKLDNYGNFLGEPHYLLNLVATNRFNQIHVAQTEMDNVLIWQDDSNKNNLIHVDKSGNISSQVFPLELPEEMYIVNLWADGADIYLIAQDNATHGQDPTNKMGLFLIQVNENGEMIELPVPLSPQSREQPYFGNAVSGSTLGRVYLDNGKINFGTGFHDSSNPIITLSNTAGGTLAIEAIQSTFFVAWEDRRDDESPACKLRGDCVKEVYFASLNANRDLLINPTRITEFANPKPFLFYYDWDVDWKALCAIDQ